MRIYRMILWIALFMFGLIYPVGSAAASVMNAEKAVAVQQAAGDPVVTVRFEGALHPVMMEQLRRAIRTAEQRGAQAIILELNTPGGSIDMMNQLVEDIRGSEIPIIVYVSPRGAMAASAGTLITLAGHASAMSPETTIGAASPVGSQGEDIGETMESKVKQMLKASARSLAGGRSPEAIQLAEDTIENARAVSVDEAVETGLVDFKASSIENLLEQLDGYEVLVLDQPVTLRTAGVEVIPVNITFTEELLTILANPNLVFLLLSVGVQAILIEIWNPGGWVAGFIGAVCILLAVYGLGVLPVNWFGILFLVMAFILFILDIQAPTHGALTAAGVAAFIMGALVLFNSPNVPSFQRVSVPLVVGTGAGLGLIFFILIGFALRTRNAPPRMGRESLIGQVGVVNTALCPVGTVQLGSELWTALQVDGGPPLPPGAQVEVVGVDGLQIKVQRVQRDPRLESIGS